MRGIDRAVGRHDWGIAGESNNLMILIEEFGLKDLVVVGQFVDVVESELYPTGLRLVGGAEKHGEAGDQNGKGHTQNPNGSATR